MFARIVRFAVLAAALGTAGMLGFLWGLASAESLLWALGLVGISVPQFVVSLIFVGSLVVWTAGGFFLGAWLLRTPPDEPPP